MIEQIDGLFVVEFAAGSLASVALYVLIANATAYFVMRKRMNEAVRELMKRFLSKAPVMCTNIGLAAGLCAYFGLIIMDTLLHSNKYKTASEVDFGRKGALVLFTLFGILYGALNGLSLFYKCCKALKSYVPEKIEN